MLKKQLLSTVLTGALLISLAGCKNPEAVTDSVKDPEFSVTTSEVDYNDKVNITCETDGAVILYTTDGTDPEINGKTFDSPISITSAITIKAIAVKDGMDNSSVKEQSYTIKTYLINFDNNGHGKTVESVRKHKNEAFNLPVALTEDGFTFQKWVLNDNKYDAGTNYTEEFSTELTFVAEWIQNTGKIEIVDPAVTDLSISYDNKSSDYKFTASSGFDYYSWSIDNEPISTNSTSNTLDVKLTNAGTYFVMVTATKGNVEYSASCYVTIQ